MAGGLANTAWGLWIIDVYKRQDGEIKTLETGNTEVVAGVIQKLTGAELFKIEPLKEYSKDYNECIAQAQSDQMQNCLLYTSF